jgi:ABC-2 type transport system permease protein
MNNLRQAIWVELLKTRRSKLPLFTALGFSLAPLAGSFFMLVLRDPDFARRTGMISAKAQLTAGTADWPTYLGLLAQATAVGGLLLFSFISSWVFGREYADRTVKDLLALPTGRSAIVCAKFTVVLVWSTLLAALILLIGLGLGTAIALPQTAVEVLWQGAVRVASTAGLTIALVTPIAFFASAGRGYLLPLGMALMTMILAQVIAAAGWGEYFPWSVPALYAGAAGIEQAQLGAVSFALVLLTSVTGLISTFVWWAWADQSQ